MTPYIIVCESASGNTAMLARGLQRHFQDQAEFTDRPDCVDPEAYDVYFVGSGIYNGDCPPKTANLLGHLKNKKVFLFGTCGFGSSKDYFENIAKRMETHVKPETDTIGHFICTGKLPETALTRFQKLQAANPNCARWARSINNYYKTVSHPDQTDMDRLINSSEQALQQPAE